MTLTNQSSTFPVDAAPLPEDSIAHHADHEAVEVQSPIPVPLVSVIIRSMDRPTLSEALDSVAQQTYAHIEVLVVNAKGEVHSEQGEWCGKFPLRVVGTGEQLRRSRAGNIGLADARGDYLIFLDDDDGFMPEHIATLMEALLREPDKKAAYSCVTGVNEQKETIDNDFCQAFDRVRLLAENYIPIHAVLFSRIVVDQGVRMDESFDLYEDWDFWLQVVVAYGDFIFVNHFSAYYRIGGLFGQGVRPDLANSQQICTRLYEKWRQHWRPEELLSMMTCVRNHNLLTDVITQKEQQIADIVTQKDQQVAEITIRKDQQVADVVTQKDQQIAEIIARKDQQLTDVVTQKDQQLADIVAQKDQQLIELNTYKDQQLAELNTYKDQQLADLDRRKNQQIIDTVTEKNQQIADTVTQKDEQMAAIISQKDQEINALIEVMLQKDQQITISATEIASLQQSVFNLESEINAIYNSTSWKISKPIRRSKLMIVGIKNAMKNPLYYLWTKTPFSLRQRNFIKTFICQHIPVIGRLFIRPSFEDINLSEPLSEYKAHSDKVESKYFAEYQSRFNTTINNLGKDYVPLAGEQIAPSRSQVKVIAFYLPQFHPIAENNKEWGQGFTEWTNVSKAVPQFAGHYQPRLPGELGFYDLRLKEVQQRQIELAKQYGIHGFCYHHYWFGGKKVLEKPFQQVLDDPSLDFPFCLCWANENWTRSWDGGDSDIILAQQHSPEDDINFIKDIVPALQDKRYIRVNGKPLLIVYRPGLLPDPAATAQRWRDYTIGIGLGDLHIVSAATFGFEDFASIDYDGLVQFPPHNIQATDITSTVDLLNSNFSGYVYDFQEFSAQAIKGLNGKQHVFPCVMMNWDNEARKPGRGFTFVGGSPKNYKAWLKQAFDFVLANNEKEEQIVFINAWNEWAEGTYLEPDRRYGYSYLNATANVIRDTYKSEGVEAVIADNNARFKKTSNTIIVVHLYYHDLIDDILAYIDDSKDVDLLVTLPAHTPKAVIDTLIASLNNVYLYIGINKGRDILPFFSIFNIIESFGYDYVLKIHGKKSIHRKDGEQLRKSSFNALLGTVPIDKVIHFFETNKDIGLIAPDDSIISLANDDYLVNNKDNIIFFLGLAGYDEVDLNFDFIAGSMFWARVDALKFVTRIGLTEDNFDEELGQLDGTMAHAIERLFSYMAAKEGYKTATLAQIL